jgi:hypothetical protein
MNILEAHLIGLIVYIVSKVLDLKVMALLKYYVDPLISNKRYSHCGNSFCLLLVHFTHLRTFEHKIITSIVIRENFCFLVHGGVILPVKMCVCVARVCAKQFSRPRFQPF